MKNLEIDNLDKQILSILVNDASIPITEIAKRVFVSGPTIHVRLKKLEQMGVIKGQQMQVDYQKLGYDISAFLGIFLNKSSNYRQACDQIKEIPEVVGLHYTTGNYSMFAKIVCRDTHHLQEVLTDKIQAIEGIQRTETFISLEESINRPLKFYEDEENKNEKIGKKGKK